jgi:branched-chain amino acid transport system ATP-binding protein
MMLTISGLRAGYGQLEILRGLNIDVPAGSIVAVLGANGAGKTTLMRALIGIIRARAGAIVLDGKPIEHISTEERVQRGLALTPEGHELFRSLTVRENLVMGAFTVRDQRSLAADIDRVLAIFPRLRQHVHNPAASLSGGEAQMLAIGRALMARPRLLMLDEPSLGLAPAVVETVFQAIDDLNRTDHLTILLVEQNAHKALAVANTAYVLQHGTVALSGPASELQQNPAVRRLYLGG